LSFELILIVILGPTCTGKTSLAEKLCYKFSGEIVSADSRQVYRFMDIGTGKLPPSCHSRPATSLGVNSGGNPDVKTHLQDVVRSDQNYSVADWAASAKRALDDIKRREKIPFVVGGTGFYIDVLLGNRGIAGVAPDYILRQELEKLFCEELFAKLKKLDPEKAAEIDRKNKRRLVRAVEISKSISTSISNSTSISTSNSISNSSNIQHPTANFTTNYPLIIGLKSSNDYLYNKADQWVEKILENDALLKETAQLVEKGYRNTVPMQGMIYKTVLDYLKHQVTYDEMKQRIKWDIHGYIRRQMTWFKKSPKDTIWFDIATQNVAKEVEKKVKWYLGK